MASEAMEVSQHALRRRIVLRMDSQTAGLEVSGIAVGVRA
jgi:hypothetical protein